MRYLLKSGNMIILAFDHGFEHGPAVYNVDMSPKRIMNLAIKGGVDALMVNKGIAKHLPQKIRKDVKMIIKLTGRTSLNPLMVQSLTGTVEDAIELDADAIAATVYIGNEYEDEMLAQFSDLYTHAKRYGFPVLGIIYPRPSDGKRYKGEYIRYAARVGSELGCDFIKTYYPKEGKGMFKRVVDDAFAPVVAAGGTVMKKDSDVLRRAEDVMAAGGAGMAIGRNVWTRNDDDAIRLLKALNDVIKRNMSAKMSVKKWGLK
ncbi:fructose-bisphosphate aldolase [Candidatus Micrarchaeota archaeon]|nr:fructose-bisphosphate aldolase [Candidatus Micrarchaeota archaeon]